MLATLTDASFDSPDWVFESKWDGFRMVTAIERGKVMLYSRNGKVLTQAYAPVARALASLRSGTVLDGELVALDARGISRFQLLQNALRAEAKLSYRVFDLMFLDGVDLRRLPLLERKERLERVLPRDPLLAFSQHRLEHGNAFFKEAEERGLEGIIAKRALSFYRSGARSTDWLKIKAVRQQEAVIVGFTAPRRSRPYFGALVLALYEGNGWRYIGHVGTGFTHTSLKTLHDKLAPLHAERSPFKHRVAQEATTTWVKPRLVAEIKFTEWTSAGEMRHPAFLGLREDKRAQDVVAEVPVNRPTTRR
jgi:bifunctional non-homologous end joining protein LigD